MLGIYHLLKLGMVRQHRSDYGFQLSFGAYPHSFLSSIVASTIATRSNTTIRHACMAYIFILRRLEVFKIFDSDVWLGNLLAMSAPRE